MTPHLSATATAILFALGASVAWAFANVAVQRSTRLIGTFRGLLWAQVAGCIVAATLAVVFGEQPTALSRGALAWLAGAGVASLLAYLCMFYALEHGRLSIAVPIMSGWAVIATAISVLVLGEPVRPRQLGAAALVIAGVVLASRYAGAPATAAATHGAAAPPPPPPPRRWILASMGAALGFGVLIPSLGRVTPAFGRIGAVAVVFGAGILLVLPLSAIRRVDLRPPSRRAWVPVALAGLCETTGYVCIALTVGRAPLAIVSPLASLASPLTVLYAWVVLRDRPPAVALVGAALACAGGIALAL